MTTFMKNTANLAVAEAKLKVQIISLGLSLENVAILIKRAEIVGAAMAATPELEKALMVYMSTVRYEVLAAEEEQAAKPNFLKAVSS